MAGERSKTRRGNIALHDEQPRHRMRGTTPRKLSDPAAQARRSAASAAGVSTSERLRRNLVTSVGARTNARNTRNVRAAQLRTDNITPEERTPRHAPSRKSKALKGRE